MLKVENVSKRYKKDLVLNKVDLTVADGECISLIGKSGSGKSTLCRLILGLEKPSGGRILWNGSEIGRLKKKQLYQEIQPVFQDNTGCFNPRMKIGESLCEPMTNFYSFDKKEKFQKMEKLLEMVELPAEIADRYPFQLSGGQQKRVCIARAISIKPRLMILDEAVSGLDAIVMKKILTLLKKLQKELGCSYLFITHDLKAARFMSQKIAVMEQGRISDKRLEEII